MSPICACCDRHSRHRPPGPMNTNMCMRKTGFFFWKESQNSLPTEGPGTSLYLILFLHSLNFPISCLQSLLLLGIQGHRSPSALVCKRLRICQALINSTENGYDMFGKQVPLLLPQTPTSRRPHFRGHCRDWKDGHSGQDLRAGQERPGPMGLALPWFPKHVYLYTYIFINGKPLEDSPWPLRTSSALSNPFPTFGPDRALPRRPATELLCKQPLLRHTGLSALPAGPAATHPKALDKDRNPRHAGKAGSVLALLAASRDLPPSMFQGPLSSGKQTDPRAVLGATHFLLQFRHTFLLFQGSH